MWIIAKEIGERCQFLLGSYPYRWHSEDRSLPVGKHLLAFGNQEEALAFLDRATEEMVDGFFVGAVPFMIGFNADQIDV